MVGGRACRRSVETRACFIVVAFTMSAMACAQAADREASPQPAVAIVPVGRISTGFFDLSSAEIPAYHAATRRLFIVNGAEGLDVVDVSDVVDVIDVSNPATLRRIACRRMRNPTSVAIHGDLIAVAALGASADAPGTVRFFDPEGTAIGRVEVGHGPDMIAFTPDGRTLLVACEGEPSPTDPSIDPRGSISFVDLSRGAADATVVDAGFEQFEANRLPLSERGFRAVTPGRTLAQEIEPEYIAVSPDGRFAFATLQENNAIAVIDVPSRRIASIEPLGFRDCARPGQGMDAIDDGIAAPAPVPVLAMHQPDAIVAFEHEGELWLMTANEGEARRGSFEEPITLQQARLVAGDTIAAPLPEGGLLVSCVRAPASAGGGFCAFGSRGVSIWRVDTSHIAAAHAGASDEPIISMAWDSGDALERIVAERSPSLFNSDHRRAARIDARSLSSGPEPEGLAIATIGGRRLAFVALERSGGVVAVDVTSPSAPVVVGYSNTRDEGVDLSVDTDRNGVPDSLEQAGDLGPEGLVVVPAESSPTGRDLLIVCFEVSGTTTIFEIRIEAPSKGER